MWTFSSIWIQTLFQKTCLLSYLETLNFSKIPPIFTYICTFGFGFGIRPKARWFSGFGLKWKTYFWSFGLILWLLISFSGEPRKFSFWLRGFKHDYYFGYIQGKSLGINAAILKVGLTQRKGLLKNCTEGHWYPKWELMVLENITRLKTVHKTAIY